jgi:hypothetical protein
MRDSVDLTSATPDAAGLLATPRSLPARQGARIVRVARGIDNTPQEARIFQHFAAAA